MASDDEPFLYTGQSRDDIPRNVTHVKVDPSVKVIGMRAFSECSQLRNVDLNEGLEQIEAGAFYECTSLQRIVIPSTVKEIGSQAFDGCFRLRKVELCEGLELIGDVAFEDCISLQRISIPSTVKEIGEYVFGGCGHLMNVELREGLELIGEKAFKGCSSLQSIHIPSTVTWIAADAFKDCSGLIAIEFCEQIEQFVHDISLSWWNNGVSEVSLRTYSFLAEGIPARLGTIKSQTWKDNIHDMLQHIPEVWEYDDNGEDWDEPYFDSIEHRLSNYEQAQEVAPFLELALWKTKIMEQSNGNLINNNKKNLCRIDSFSMFGVVFPNVLSFLVEE
jgi:BspA type Leucine rich repeat region (6 copies)